MSSSVHVLADDLTGALDCAAAFAHGAEVPVALGPPEALPWRSPVEVCSTASRAVDPAEMARRLCTCLPWLADATLRFKKVDSLLRGNSFAELGWLAASGRFRYLVLAPAFPALQRRVVNGALVVDGAPPGPSITLHEGLAPFGLTRRADGTGRIDSTHVVLPDTANDAELDAVAAAFAREEGVLWCGSAGLALALARARGFGAPSTPKSMAPASDVLIATASRHPVMRSQLEQLSATLGQTPAAARVRLEDLASAEDLPPSQAEAALAANAVRIVASRPPQALVVIGGDSLLAICRATQAQGLVAMQSPRLGWGSARLIGGRWDGVRCLSRSGAFGRSDDLTALLASLGVVAPGRLQPESALS